MQPSSFFLAPDLNDAGGNQVVSSLDVLLEQLVSIQIFAADIRNASGITVRLRFDSTIS